MQEIRKWNYNRVTEIREEFRGMEQQRNICACERREEDSDEKRKRKAR